MDCISRNKAIWEFCVVGISHKFFDASFVAR